MKKHTCIPALLALALLAGACTLPPVRSVPLPPPNKEAPPPATPVHPEKHEKPVVIVPSETKGKRVSLIPQKETTVPAKETPAVQQAAPPAAAMETPPVPAEQPQPSQPPPSQPQVFTDYNTGLSFTYQRPWHLVSTQGEGPILGRDGRSQMTVRFTTLTTDKDKGEKPGYFYVPDDSITAAISKTVQSVLGRGETHTTQGKTPLDVLLTQKHFPSLIIGKRYRGNNGGMIIQSCRHKRLPGQIQVYHVFIKDKVASFSLSEIKNRRLKLEMQQIVFSTKKL